MGTPARCAPAHYTQQPQQLPDSPVLLFASHFSTPPWNDNSQQVDRDWQMIASGQKVLRGIVEVGVHPRSLAMTPPGSYHMIRPQVSRGYIIPVSMLGMLHSMLHAYVSIVMVWN
jgi:hypothetical protein